MSKKPLFILLALVLSFAANCSRADVVETRKPGQSTPSEKDEFVTVEQAAATALKAGDKMPAFELPNAKNQKIKSGDLLKESNLVVVFYRGGWCPYCNTYLKKLQDEIEGIEKAGGTLVAISAENPDDSLTTEQKHKLKFHVLSDDQLSYARKVGLVYQLPDKTNERYKTKGIDIVVSNDMDKPELPISATYIISRDGKIVYAFVEPDYKKRAQPETVIEELNKISKAAV